MRLCLLSVAVLGLCPALAGVSRPDGFFRPGTVTVGGEIGRRMEITLEKMLRHTDIERTFVRHFRTRHEKNDEIGGFAGYGMFLDALVKAAAHGIGGAGTVAAKDRLLRELADLQTPDGRISMFSGKPGQWDNHEAAYLIQALSLDHRWFGSESSLLIARRLADSLIASKSYTTLGSETAFLLLFAETGERRYLDWVERDAYIHADIGTYDRKVKVNGAQQVYTFLARALAQLQYADWIGADGVARTTLTDAAEEAFRRARGPYLSVTGSITGTPWWGEYWDDTQTGLGKWGETCASAYLMRLAAKAGERGTAPSCGDLFERVMYNAFFAAQSSDGLRYRYYTPFNQRGEWFKQDTYCCPNNYKREVFEIPDFVFLRTADGIAVNLYSDAELKDGDIAIGMKTAYPDDGTVLLDVRMPPDRRVLKLRIPAWCADATVQVADDAKTAAKPGWFAIECDFSASVRVRLDLPMPVRLVPGIRAQEGRVAVMRGPCVYALVMGDGDEPEYNVDIWDLDLSFPLAWNAAKRTVDATIRLNNRRHETRSVSLVRFASDRHDRIYFKTIVGDASRQP